MRQYGSIFLNKYRSPIIFVCVSLIVFQGFYFIYLYGTNLPYWDEYDLLPFIESFVEGESFWEVDKFYAKGDHIYLFPSIATLFSVAFSAWNVTYLMYFGLSLVTISVYLLYLMLKDIDSRIVWVIIPIAAFLYNPNQYEVLLWGFASEIFFFSITSITASIFFLRKIKDKNSFFIPAIVFAIIASFSNIGALIIWLIGIATFYFSKKLKLLLIWLSGFIASLIIYFVINTSHHVDPSNFTNSLFNEKSFLYVFLFVSNGLDFESSILQVFFGFIIISFLVIGSIFLKIKRNDFEKILPWTQLGLIGLLFAGVTLLMRVDVSSPITSRYIPLANTIESTAIVIGSILFLMLIDSKKRKSVKIVFLVALVILSGFVALGLINSYQSGWEKGGAFATGQVFYGLSCLYKSDTDLRCGPPIYPNPDRLHNQAQKLLKLHISPFSIPNYSFFMEDPLLQDESWSEMKKIDGLGEIEYINAEKTSSNEKIPVEKNIQLIHSTGWAKFVEEVNVDSAYVFIDDRVNSRSMYGFNIDPSLIWQNNNESTDRWMSSVDLSNIDQGCHDVSFRIVNDNAFSEIKSKSALCIN